MKYDSAVELKRSLLEGGLREKIPTIESLPRANKTIKSARVSDDRNLPSPLAIGIRQKNGEYRLAVRVQTVTPGVELAVRKIELESKGEFDVKMVGRVLKQSTPWYQSKNRPLSMGGSVGHVDVTVGTLGAFVSIGDEDFILSNNHVLANENQASVGDMIVQPGVSDGGKPSDGVGELTDYVGLALQNNLVDAALASIDEGIEYYYGWLEDLGQVTGVRTAPFEEGEMVYKLGRTTGITVGVIAATEIDELVVGYDIADLSFDNQIEIEPLEGEQSFSLGGDSGSLIVDENMLAVGLLFAGNDVDSTYANPITTVLDSFGAEILI